MAHERKKIPNGMTVDEILRKRILEEGLLPDSNDKSAVNADNVQIEMELESIRSAEEQKKSRDQEKQRKAQQKNEELKEKLKKAKELSDMMKSLASKIADAKEEMSTHRTADIIAHVNESTLASFNQLINDYLKIQSDIPPGDYSFGNMSKALKELHKAADTLTFWDDTDEISKRTIVSFRENIKTQYNIFEKISAPQIQTDDEKEYQRYADTLNKISKTFLAELKKIDAARMNSPSVLRFDFRTQAEWKKDWNKSFDTLVEKYQNNLLTALHSINLAYKDIPPAIKLEIVGIMKNLNTEMDVFKTNNIDAENSPINDVSRPMAKIFFETIVEYKNGMGRIREDFLKERLNFLAPKF